MDDISKLQVKSVKIIDHELLKEESKEENKVPAVENQPEMPEEEKKDAV